MSRFEIKMPKLGESITEGTIVSWSVKVGESVQEDDVLFEVNTAKVSAEIPSPVAGKVMEILCKEGDTVAVGTVVAVINLDGDSASEQETSNESNSSQETTKEKSHNEVPKPGVAVEERWYSPVVIQLARDAKIPKEELDTLQGTGYEGRLSKKDIKDYIRLQMHRRLLCLLLQRVQSHLRYLLYNLWLPLLHPNHLPLSIPPE